LCLNKRWVLNLQLELFFLIFLANEFLYDNSTLVNADQGQFLYNVIDIAEFDL
jgi:hypothetical protein